MHFLQFVIGSQHVALSELKYFGLGQPVQTRGSVDSHLLQAGATEVQQANLSVLNHLPLAQALHVDHEVLSQSVQSRTVEVQQIVLAGLRN